MAVAAGVRYKAGELARRLVDRAVLRRKARTAPAPRSLPPDPKILLLRNNDLGDVLVITPLIEALRARFPSAHLTVAVTFAAMPCLDHNPHLSEVIAVEAPWFNRWADRVGRFAALRWIYGPDGAASLRRAGFDLGIDVLGSTWGALLLVVAGIPHRLGMSGFAGGERGFTASVPYDPAMHVGRAALRFAELLGATRLPENRPQIFLSPEEREAGEEVWRQVAGANTRSARRVVVGPGAGSADRAWPVERFREVVTRLAADDGLSMAVVGGQEEERTVCEVAGSSPRAQAFPGSLDLRLTFALVAASDLVICNSSMLMHAAAAFHRPTVVVLGESFRSAAHHQTQWGYEGTCWSLGREAREGRSSAGPEDVVRWAYARLSQ